MTDRLIHLTSLTGADDAAFAGWIDGAAARMETAATRATDAVLDLAVVRDDLIGLQALIGTLRRDAEASAFFGGPIALVDFAATQTPRRLDAISDKVKVLIGRLDDAIQYGA